MKTHILILFLSTLIISCGKSEPILFKKTIVIEKQRIVKPDSIVIRESMHSELSAKLNFKLRFYERFIGDSVAEHYWDIIVYDKKMKLRDSIRQQVFWFWPSDNISNEVKSYTTGFNSDREVSDNFEGEFVVADFNFDKKEDFAVRIDNGGNGGPSYSYYLQDKKFAKDLFLQDSMVYFPTDFDRVNRQLITVVHAGACHVSEHKYKLGDKKWTERSRRLIDLCNGERR